MLLKEQYDVLVTSLLPYAQKRLGFNKPPVINFLQDEENSSNPLGKTGYYEPTTKEINVFISNRHPKDILRSVAHELVHYNQDCNGRFSDSLHSKLQDAQYAQNNPELRKFEKEAYLHGNMIFRDWEDNYKNKSNKTITIIRNTNKMNENQLRNIISKLISEIAEESKKDKKEKEQRATPEVKDSAKKYLKFKKSTIAEVEDTDSISLNEWKRQELFGLLSNKFIGRNLSETSHKEDDEEETEEEKKSNLKKAKSYAKASGGSDVKTDSKGRITSKPKPFSSQDSEDLKKAKSYAKASGGSDPKVDPVTGKMIAKPKPFPPKK